MSGHSKWAQIKHKKASVDAKRGREFSKFIQEIMVAARTGGPNEDANPRLRAAIERARSLGLPKDNIERAVARATGSGDDTKLVCTRTGTGTATVTISVSDGVNQPVTNTIQIIQT